MTTSSHPKIETFAKYRSLKIPMGTGGRPGILTGDSKEALVLNYS